MLRIEECKITHSEKPKSVRQEIEQMKAIINSKSSLSVKTEMMKQLIERR